MPLFKILSTDRSYRSETIDSRHAGAVFFLVQRLECKEADVLADDVYSFSVRLDENGVWSIFKRNHRAGWRHTSRAA